MDHRHDFIYLFDAKDANPNGDPDAGNQPRVDAESGHGLVTDVCLKRKVRNFISLTKNHVPPHDIYVKEKAVLVEAHEKAWLAVEEAGDKHAQGRGKDREAEKAGQARAFMCRNFFDIRAFGAVMNLSVNCGQVRGPVQLGFARSIDPVSVHEHAITRVAVATRREAEAQQGNNRTMSRKFTIPYALYRAHGFVNPFLARQTGFSRDDLELFFQALENAFQFDQSAARPPGGMAARELLVFRHATALGSAASHDLFDRLVIRPLAEEPPSDAQPARSFAAYRPRILFDGQPLDDVVKRGKFQDIGQGITLIRRL